MSAVSFTIEAKRSRRDGAGVVVTVQLLELCDIRLSAADQGRHRIDHFLEMGGGEVGVQTGLTVEMHVKHEVARIFEVLVQPEKPRRPLRRATEE
jgi:hypothetical protein